MSKLSFKIILITLFVTDVTNIVREEIQTRVQEMNLDISHRNNPGTNYNPYLYMALAFDPLLLGSLVRYDFLNQMSNTITEIHVDFSTWFNRSSIFRSPIRDVTW